MRHKNVQPPMDPFEQEEKTPELTANSKWKKKEIEKWYAKQIANIRADVSRGHITEEEYKAAHNAIQFLKFGELHSTLDGKKDAKFLTDFKTWLIGKGRPKDHEKTPWGRNPLHFPDVYQYLKQFNDKRWNWRIKLTQLKAAGPTNLYEMWLYFKYIIREEPILPNNTDFLIEEDMLAEIPPFHDRENFGMRPGHEPLPPDARLSIRERVGDDIDPHDQSQRREKKLPYIPGHRKNPFSTKLWADDSTPNRTGGNRGPFEEGRGILQQIVPPPNPNDAEEAADDMEEEKEEDEKEEELMRNPKVDENVQEAKDDTNQPEPQEQLPPNQATAPQQAKLGVSIPISQKAALTHIGKEYKLPEGNASGKMINIPPPVPGVAVTEDIPPKSTGQQTVNTASPTAEKPKGMVNHT